jgi:hypothetical protein
MAKSTSASSSARVPFVTADPNLPRDLAFNAKRGKPGKRAPAQKALTQPKSMRGGR